MIPIKRNCRFILDKEKDKPDARIRYRIRWNGYTVSFLLGYRVDISKWIADAQRCKNNTTHGSDKVSASEINRVIEIFEEYINDVFYKYELDEKMPTDNEVREDFNFMASGGNNNALLDLFYDRFVKYSEEIKGLSKNRISSLKQTKKSILAYNKKLRLNSLNYNEFGRFVEHLYGKGYVNSTVQKHYSNIRTFLIWAKSKGFYSSDALNLRHTFNSIKDKEIIYLEWSELKKIMSVELYKENDKEIRDIFILCCFTGLRYSDVVKLKRSDIHDDHIEIITTKTRHNLKIELNRYSREIIDKYMALNKHLLFYPFNISFMNKRLKRIGKAAEINTDVNVSKISKNKVGFKTVPKHEVLSTHCGRRTFVVTALRAGIPVEVIMKWTGHSSFESMKPYIAIVDELKAKEMNKFDNIIF